jgi:hypothetical protein
MKAKIIFATMCVISSTIVALAEEPSAEDACEYFARGIPVEVQSADTQFTAIGEIDFMQVEIQLDRYVTLTTKNDVVVNFGRSDQDGQIRVGGRISASMVCFVDQKLRRVLEIRVVDGPSVGSSFQDDFGREREIVGPRGKVFMATDDMRNGLY